MDMTNNLVSLEQIVHGILVVRSDLTRDEVLRKIYEKKKTVKVRDQEAALMVASELWPKTATKFKMSGGAI